MSGTVYVPPGWKLVPVEPTVEMQRAGRDALDDFSDAAMAMGLVDLRALHSYRAMLAASPPSPVQAEPVAWFIEWRFKLREGGISPAGGSAYRGRSEAEVDAEVARLRSHPEMDWVRKTALYAHPAPVREAVACEAKFRLGDRVEKISGSSWRGRVVGTYRTSLTPEGYAVESENEPGSVQIYPAAALRAALSAGGRT